MRASLSVAISPFNVSISPSRSSMAWPLFVCSSSRLSMVAVQVASCFDHSVSRVDFSSRKSARSLLSVSMMPCEWYWYVASTGSSFALAFATVRSAACCRKALTAWRLGFSRRPITSAKARLLSTDERTAMSAAGWESSMAFTAFSSEATALARSAAAASYSAFCLAQRVSASRISRASCSCLALRSCSSASFASMLSVLSAILAEYASMLSRPEVMDEDLVPVDVLQKQANSS
mmetsp:Transcript_125182/g.312787  ORF Transcript_125182/g.312787 Transcript_125182/m.312787 type:complete len:234 (+) Transcript_125182:381-1082(+)